MKRIRIISTIAVMILFLSLLTRDALFAQEPKREENLSVEEKLARQEAFIGLEEQRAEQERAHIELEALLKAQAEEINENEQQARRETDLIRRKLEEEIMLLQKKAEQEAQQRRKALEEEEARALKAAMQEYQRQAKEWEKEMKRNKLKPPRP
ncbi:MAG: hypothetical protein KJ893_06640 [Candidatus Omnitrophica bacterium]|nr:hypothetical protein [Candidatus Omnitrophota bacterium]MBU4479457.1 hypothetical protein [Candidatus Omnitrophota bacterium]